MELKFFLQDVIQIEDKVYHVNGMVSYKNAQDGSYWTEYRLMEEGTYREFWLSVDEVYQEYAMYQMERYQDRFSEEGIASARYREADSGVQIVTNYQGKHLDVDVGEKAKYWEYEDKTTERIISIEEWSDGREYSTGYYIDKEDIKLMKRGQGDAEESSHNNFYAKNDTDKKATRFATLLTLGVLFVSIIVFIIPTFNFGGSNSVKKYIEGATSTYTYRTSVTSDLDTAEKADVYVSTYNIDATARDIIQAVEGDVEDVQQNTEDEDDSIAILTDNEYCLIYTSSDNETLVQISKRSYAYCSSNTPYRCSVGTGRYFRRFYYSRGYSSDKGRYSKKRDSYTSYDDSTLTSTTDTYKSYASSVRQSSIARRRSSGGGTSFGK
ncbi:MAG: DUF4178 domain-containing protein [Lachnospiraceae bacterium]|nr:DUF4178 domain-containing protein [Lachnospiraceae bacterium]